MKLNVDLHIATHRGQPQILCTPQMRHEQSGFHCARQRRKTPTTDGGENSLALTNPCVQIQAQGFVRGLSPLRAGLEQGDRHTRNRQALFWQTGAALREILTR